MFDATFFAFVGLILFLLLMVYFKVPSLLAAGLDKRGETIKSDLEEARRLREEAQSVLAEYKRKHRDAESEAEEIVDAARREAEALAADAKVRLEEFVERRTKVAEDKIAQAELQAVLDVKAASANKAVAAAEKILAEKMSEDSASYMKKAIEEVKAQLN